MAGSKSSSPSSQKSPIELQQDSCTSQSQSSSSTLGSRKSSSRSSNLGSRKSSSRSSNSSKQSSLKDRSRSQSSQQAELPPYWNCPGCFPDEKGPPQLPKVYGGSFTTTEADYKERDWDKDPENKVEICPPVQIIQPTFNDFYGTMDKYDAPEDVTECPFDKETEGDEDELTCSTHPSDPCQEMEQQANELCELNDGDPCAEQQEEKEEPKDDFNCDSFLRDSDF